MHPRFPSLLGLALGALAAGLAGCGPRETLVDIGNRTQTLHIVRGAEPQELDPHVVTGQTEHQIIMSLLEGLVTEDPVDLHPVPGVAERWDISADALVNDEVFTYYPCAAITLLSELPVPSVRQAASCFHQPRWG